jgi:O-antigen/teichoic acid export membrane protein
MMTKIRVSPPVIREIFKYSLLVGLSDMGLFLYTRADVLVLGHYNLVEEIGYYEIVNRIFLILILPAQLLATVVAPKIAQIFLLKKTELIRSNYARDVILLFCSGLLLAGITYLGMGFVFTLLFKNYDVNMLRSLMVILLFLIPFRFFSTYISIGYITPSGNVLISTVAIILFGILNVILDFLLVRDFGVFGIVYATFISQILFILTKDLIFYLRVIKKC